MSSPRFSRLIRVCLVVAAGLLLSRVASAQSAVPAGDITVQDLLEIPEAIDTPSVEEDLNSLSLPPGGLIAEEPVSGGVKETEDYISELYRMQWRNGDPIDVFVIRPKGVARPPVAIYLYGFPVDPDRFRNDEFCKTVTRGGVAAIGFNPALTAERYHDVPMRQWFIGQLHDSIVKTVHDVQMIVNYAQSRPDLDSHRIGIFGQGSGATIAGLAATVDPRLQAVDLLDPWGDWPAWLAESKLVPEQERPGFLTPEFLKPLDPLDPVLWLPRLKGRSLKLDDVAYENETPAAAKASMDARLPSGALLVRYLTRSDFEKDAIEDGRLLSWLKGQLQAEPAVETRRLPHVSTQVAGSLAQSGTGLSQPVPSLPAAHFAGP